MVRRTLKVPSESIIADGFGHIDYVDSYSVPVGEGNLWSRLVTKIFCNGPAWVDKLMALGMQLWVALVSKPFERGRTVQTFMKWARELLCLL
jgi:hypothetical protein